MADRSSLEEGFPPTDETESLLYHRNKLWKRWKPHCVIIVIILTILVGIVFAIALIASIIESNGNL